MPNKLQPTVWAGLRTLLSEVRRSPIFIRSLDRRAALFRRQWAMVRKSDRADAFVLAWLASERAGTRRMDVLH
jgi:hypothetical protein